MTKQLDWVDIDPASLSAEQRNAYEAYKAKYREAKALRQAFEDTVQELAPHGKRIAVNYNFGKLSFAVAEQEARKVAKGTISLSAFMAQQAQHGRL